jgi:hypothetical protein
MRLSSRERESTQEIKSAEKESLIAPHNSFVLSIFLLGFFVLALDATAAVRYSALPALQSKKEGISRSSDVGFIDDARTVLLILQR